MIKEWWNKQTGINQVCGLEIIFNPNKEVQVHLCSLKLENNAVSIIHQSTHLSLKSTLEKLKGNKTPLAINFSGEGVISRVIPLTQSNSAIDIAFPGIEKQKFYIQEFHQKAHVIVSLINRKAIDAVLNQFKEDQIINISLGGFVPAILKAQTDQNTLEFSFGSHFLVFDEAEEVVNYEFKKENQKDDTIRFEGIKVKGDFFNAFAQAFQLFFYPQLLPIGLESRKENLIIFYKSGKIKLASALLLAFIFIILIINFLLWNSWTEERKGLENQLLFNKGMVDNRDSLFSKITRQEQQIKNLGILPFSHQQLIYEIGNAVPVGIKLLSIKINPDLEDKGEYGKSIIKGELQNVKAYEQFKENLKKSKLNLKIGREDLSYNENKKVTLFEIRILLFKNI